MRNWVATGILAMMFTTGARADKHALLVGVGRYQASIRPLEGPVPDVTALRKALTKSWGFPNANITDLTDAGATKEAILAELDKLVAKLKPGDVGFFYFSGHGTSAYDRDLREKAAVFSPESGALVPYDAKIGTAAQVAASLIAGNKDVRPRLLRVHPQATMLVVFDSCYSGASARSLIALPTRGLPLSDLVTKQMSDADLDAFGAPPSTAGTATGTTAKPAAGGGWPYRNVVYISASSKMEKAIDITKGVMREHPTVDGDPHGAMTNALLAGMAGEGDTNHDGAISYEELYRFTTQRVEAEFPHKPQFESPGAEVSRLPLFGQLRAPAMTTEAARPGVTRVRLENVAPDLRVALGTQANTLIVASGPFDLLVRPAREGGYDLFHSSYDRIQHYAVQAELVQRIAQHGQAAQLVSLAYPRQRFNVNVMLRREDGTAGEAEFYMGDQVRMMVSTEKPCHLMALNIDTAGQATILHVEQRPVAAGAWTPLGGPLNVQGPLGTEYVKVIAFEQPPAGFAAWADRTGKTYPPDSADFQQLMAFLRAAGGAQVTTKLVTSRRP